MYLSKTKTKLYPYCLSIEICLNKHTKLNFELVNKYDF